ncbi:uncharacterized protein [Callorhinus ursinus]|uniref:uncharacterized protein n=1 Tax=Callorhinus ursinus TaxID=34884 RepID=UPI003CD0153D
MCARERPGVPPGLRPRRPRPPTPGRAHPPAPEPTCGRTRSAAREAPPPLPARPAPRTAVPGQGRREGAAPGPRGQGEPQQPAAGPPPARRRRRRAGADSPDTGWPRSPTWLRSAPPEGQRLCACERDRPPALGGVPAAWPLPEPRRPGSQLPHPTRPGRSSRSPEVSGHLRGLRGWAPGPGRRGKPGRGAPGKGGGRRKGRPRTAQPGAGQRVGVGAAVRLCCTNGHSPCGGVSAGGWRARFRLYIEPCLKDPLFMDNHNMLGWIGFLIKE